MSDPSTDCLTHCYQDLRKGLEMDGWGTPQCYSSTFDAPGDFSAVYLFMLVDSPDFNSALPAYVGMSTRLEQRWSGHPVLRELEAMDHWVQRWFLRVPKPELRTVESKLIHKFDPPWNIIGRRRGLVVQ